MNLKRIRIDPDGLITQDQKGILKRIPLTNQEILKIINNHEKLKKYRPTFYSLEGVLDARLDIDLTDTNFLNRPLRIYYGIEPRCNLDCKFCGPRDFHEGLKPATPEFEDLLLKNFSDSGAFQIQLTGGEIGIRGHNFVKTVKKAADLGIAVIIGTNGVWRCIDYKEKFLKELSSCGNIIQSKVSIEGTRIFHESIRGINTYDSTIETLSMLSEYNLNPRINATIFKSSCNVKELSHLVNLAIKYRAGLQPIPLRPTGLATELINEMPTKEMLREYTKIATKLRRETGVHISFNFDIYDSFTQIPIYDLRSPVSCGAPLMGHHVTHTGECYPCGFAQELSQFLCGKISDTTSYLDIWRNNEVLEIVRKAGKSNECINCNDYGKGCWGGCWVMAYIFTNKINGLDPYCLKY